MTDNVLKGVELELAKVRQQVDVIATDADDKEAFAEASNSLNKTANLFRFIEYPLSVAIVKAVADALAVCVGDAKSQSCEPVSLQTLMDVLEILTKSVELPEQDSVRQSQLRDCQHLLGMTLEQHNDPPDVITDDDIGEFKVDDVSQEEDGSGDFIYQMIREEMYKELGSAGFQYAFWRRSPDNTRALPALRKSLSTIKSSSRLVGADDLVDFARQGEAVLDDNQVCDDASTDMIGLYMETLGKLLDNVFKGAPLPEASLARLAVFFETIGSTSKAEASDNATETEQSATPPGFVLSDDDVGNIIEADNIAPYIYDIFKDEVHEELERIVHSFPAWKNNIDDKNTLAEFRRSFHTLKGTSHVAGVEPFAEYSKAGEYLLNRVIEGSIAPDDRLFDLLDKVVYTLGVAVERLFSKQGLPLSTMAQLQELAAIFPNLPQAQTDAVTAAPAETLRTEESASHPVTEKPKPQVSTNDAVVLCTMDEELCEVYRTESLANLDMLEKAASSLPQHQNVPDSLLRALHSLHGSSEVAGVQWIAQLSGALNRLLLDVNACGQTANETDAALLGRFVALARRFLPLINKATQESFDGDTLLADIQQRHNSVHIADTEPVAMVEDEDNKALAAIESFLGTTGEIRSAFHARFNDWREHPDSLMAKRAFAQHLSALGSAAHSAELDELNNLSADMGLLVDDNSVPDELGFATLGQGVDIFESVFDNMHLNRSAQMPADELTLLSDQIADSLHRLQQGRATEAPVADGGMTPPSQAPDTDLHHSSTASNETSAASHNPEVMGLFLEEADELTDRLDTAYDAWLMTPASREAVDMQLRQLHTLKGNARLTNLVGVADLSHVLESLFERIINGDIDADSSIQALVRSAYDALQHCVDVLHDNAPPLDLSTVISAVQNAVNGRDWEIGLSLTTETLSRRSPKSKQERGVGEKPVLHPDEDSTGDRRVRVSGVLLDKLIKQSGEMNIAHRDLEARNSAERFNLSELAGTIARLQRQLSLLDVETDAKIVARTRDVKTADGSSFDPLEMDHYSTLQHISRSIAETVDDLAEIGEMMGASLDERDSLVLSGAMRTRELHDHLLTARQQPAGQLYSRLMRVVRMAARETAKEVRFEMTGHDVRIDGHMLQGVVAPLEHLLRNAVAHGIETSANRPDDKAKQGLVRLEITQDSSKIEIKVSDDGAGLDAHSIRQNAIAKGLLSAETLLSEQDLFRLIVSPGFSTARSVSGLSGRGVGMDAVVDGVRQLGGTLSIASQKGRGSLFTLRLPASRSITKALLINASDQTYAIPHGTVDRIRKLPSEQLIRGYEAATPEVVIDGNEHRLYHLGSLLGLSAPGDLSAKNDAALLLFELNDQPVAVHVDALVGTSEIQVHPAGEQLKQLPWFVDSTILASGDIALVLDLPSLLSNSAIASGSVLVAERVEQRERPLIMVVDDSLTVRKITCHTLERKGLDVVTAKDGVDAISVLQDVIPDIMLLDVEMPRMNGFELARQMSNTPAFRDIPIIMITSRTGDKHRKQAFDLGVRHYLGKPFNESELLNHIHELLREQQYG